LKRRSRSCDTGGNLKAVEQGVRAYSRLPEVAIDKELGRCLRCRPISGIQPIRPKVAQLAHRIPRLVAVEVAAGAKMANSFGSIGICGTHLETSGGGSHL